MAPYIASVAQLQNHFASLVHEFSSVFVSQHNPGLLVCGQQYVRRNPVDKGTKGPKIYNEKENITMPDPTGTIHQTFS